MTELDLSRAAWRKSSRSNGNGGQCVEVADVWRKSGRSSGQGGQCVEVAPAVDRAIAVRDSKNPDGPKLAFAPDSWGVFVMEVKAGRFDL